MRQYKGERATCREIRLVEGNAKFRHLKNWPVKRDFAAGVYLSEAQDPPATMSGQVAINHSTIHIYWFYKLHVWTREAIWEITGSYISLVLLGNVGGGGGELTRVEGGRKQGRKYHQHWMHARKRINLQSTCRYSLIFAMNYRSIRKYKMLSYVMRSVYKRRILRINAKAHICVCTECPPAILDWRPFSAGSNPWPDFPALFWGPLYNVHTQKGQGTKNYGQTIAVFPERRGSNAEKAPNFF